MEFFTTSTSNLLKYSAAAAVKHYVALSVVGTERIPDSPYLPAVLRAIDRGNRVPQPPLWSQPDADRLVSPATAVPAVVLVRCPVFSDRGVAARADRSRLQSPVSSRSSHSFARRQSRLTV